MIELEGVTKLYRTVLGVNDISLQLQSGAFGLLGPNGSGKTTLINLILGQIRPTLGTVRLFGKSPWKNDRLTRRIGLCPTVEIAYPNVSAKEWVTFLVQMHGFALPAAKQAACRALELVKLDHAMDRPIGTYSLGMRQRAKLAQAIAHDPDLLILDEPFNGLDPVGRFEMTEFLRNWVRDGKSLILASHILYEVEAVHPAFLLISGGRLLASGTPQEVRQILADSPSEVVVHCNQASRLASLLCEQNLVQKLNILADQQIRIVTPSAAKLFEQLPGICQQHGIVIDQLTSENESLQSLFATLMRIHRGET
ncbi:MAG: ABC transporter ATP-binding protein [Planctomycetales bacterium]|nr:ABC transporter ATP-binding protein [Planctomycetales bacterium]